MDRDRVIKTAMVSMATFVRQNWEVATPQSCSAEWTERVIKTADLFTRMILGVFCTPKFSAYKNILKRKLIKTDHEYFYLISQIIHPANHVYFHPAYHFHPAYQIYFHPAYQINFHPAYQVF